jgi:putative transcriptional regulator
MESLQGHFLIATSKMSDPRFAQTVVFVCAHNEDGAMGLIIIQPIEGFTLADLYASIDRKPPGGKLPPLYMGGPVEVASAFFLCSAEYEAKSFLTISSTVTLTRDPSILDDLANGDGPRYFIHALGYAGWGVGQLENELTVDGWLIMPGDDDVLFHTPDELKWKKAAARYGIDISLYGDTIGTA